jgi:outer membrane protein insertion porin family
MHDTAEKNIGMIMRLNNILKIAFLGFSLSFVSVYTGGLTSGTVISSAQAAVVSNIDVRGNQRIDDEIVASYLTIKPGQSFNDFDIDDSVKALFATGLFGDVSIFRQGSTLVVDVEENGTVNKVFFEGNKRLKDDVLENVARLRAQGIYSDEQAASDVERIKLAYARVGRQDADVSYEVLPLANNRVNVIYRVNEGDKTKISRIDFIGNNTFSARRLADVISTKETGLLGFLQTSDIYDENRLNSDEELLRRFYLNKGFADFQVLSTQAVLDDVENEYTVTITVDEGARYTFGNIAIETSLNGVENIALDNLVETQTGEFYNAKDVEDTVVSITERVAEEGFAFVEVVPRGNRNFETNTIDVTYLVDEGARVFIEDIRILGNDRTRDYVIRREFEISEGDAYNRVLVQKTRDRIRALGFFENVSVSTRPGSQPDRVILFVNVLEQTTGDISLSGGFSSNGGASGEFSFTERNFLGRGQFIRASYRGSEDEDSYGFNFTEPYFLGSRVSAGIGINSTRSEDNENRRFTVNTDSATVTFGLPLTEHLSSSVFYTYSNTETLIGGALLDDDDVPAGSLVSAGPPAINDSADPNVTNGVQGDSANELSAAFVDSVNATDGDFVSSGVGYSFVYNTLDNQQAPREGLRAAFTQTYFGAGGDANYLRTEASVAAYETLSEEQDIILFGRLRGGHIEVFGDDDNTGFRTLDNFQARQNYVRGFDSFGFGPRDPITGDALGGRTYWTATAEVLFPLPFVSRSLGLRGAFFADAGQITDPGNPAIASITNAAALGGIALSPAQLEELDSSSVRASVGASLLWASPFGPLRLDYAFPINDEEFDDVEEFNFGVSSAF